MFWRVFGPAWTRSEIDYQLELLKESGIGGVTLFVMYPVALDSPSLHNQRFLSDEFLETLGYAVSKAKALGLRFSVAGGTGWPFGGPSVIPENSAQRLRPVKVEIPGDLQKFALPALGKGERFLAIFSGTNDVTISVNLSTRLFEPCGVTNALTAYVTGPTYMRVKRPALGAEGLIVDHYSSEAARNYLNAVVEPMLRAAPHHIESVFCDSLEVYGANWTANLPAEFRRRRGYDLLPHLPELFDGGPGSVDLRFDFWRTLAELTEVRFTRSLYDWSHRHGVKLEMEAYGTPPNPLTAARYIDLPTGEQYEWRGFSLSRLASSGAHLAGKRIIGAEAWTWVGIPNRLGDSLSDIKLASDLHFLSGINDLTGVDFAYSPRAAGAPGWLPYYGPVFNQNNPQWPWFRHLIAYTSRCQWLLRQGKPVADVALYLPVEDKFAAGPVDQMLLGFQLRDHFCSGELTGEFGLKTALRHRSDIIQGLLMSGFNFDGLDFFALDRLVSVKEGRLEAGDGKYRILILPRLEGLEIGALQKVVSFCRSGGTVLITSWLPQHVYGAGSSSAQQRSVSLLKELVGEPQKSAHPWSRPLGRGRVIFVPDEDDGLLRVLATFRPDVRLAPQDDQVGFIHRQAGALDIYFLANVSEHWRSFQADFNVAGDQVEEWNPLTGEIRGRAATETIDGFRRLHLQLAPRGSTFIVFGSKSLSVPAELPPRLQTEELRPTWHVTFPETTRLPPLTMRELYSWALWSQNEFYSGPGTYSATFEWKHPLPHRAFLELSCVHEVAKVNVNGKDAGVAWIPPYSVEISRLLVPGTNSLSITVANTQLNLFLGTPDQDLGALRSAFGDRFPAPEEKKLVVTPVPSGLLGPVEIRFSAE